MSNLLLLSRVEKALEKNKFSRGMELKADAGYAISLSWPSINFKTGEIKLKTSIRTFGPDGENSKVYSGFKVDEHKGIKFSVWNAVKNTGLKTYKNSVVVHYNVKSAGIATQNPEVMTMKFQNNSDAQYAAHNIKNGFC